MKLREVVYLKSDWDAGGPIPYGRISKKLPDGKFEVIIHSDIYTVSADELVVVEGYKGRWDCRYSHILQDSVPHWNPMPSLRKMKKRAYKASSFEIAINSFPK